MKLRVTAGQMLLVATLPLAVGSCFPAVTHGPRIESGSSLGLTVSRTVGPTYVEGDEGGIALRRGIMGLYYSGGVAPATKAYPGILVGLTLPVPGFMFAQGDLFMQLPPALTPSFSAGAGVNASYDSFAWYGQVGHINDAGDGWFLTQGVSRRKPSDYYSTSVASVSGAAVQLTSGKVRSYLFLQYAVGHIPGSCFTDIRGTAVCLQGEPSHAMNFGVSLERFWKH